jgi:hypothetical protein
VHNLREWIFAPSTSGTVKNKMFEFMVLNNAHDERDAAIDDVCNR